MFPKKKKGLGKWHLDEYNKAHRKVRDYMMKKGIPKDGYIGYRTIGREIELHHQTVKRHVEAILTEYKDLIITWHDRRYLCFLGNAPPHLMKTYISNDKGELDEARFAPSFRFPLFEGVLESLFAFARQSYEEKNKELSLQFSSGIDMLYWEKNAIEIIEGLKAVLPHRVQVVYVFGKDRFIEYLKMYSDFLQRQREASKMDEKIKKAIYGEGVSKMRECVICGKEFEEGYNPKFDKKYGICKKCIKKMNLSDKTDEELKEVFMDFV